MAATGDNNKGASAPVAARAEHRGSVGVCGDGTNLFLFAKGPDNALWWRQWVYATTKQWTDWKRVGGYLTSDPAVVRSAEDGTLNVYARGGDGALWIASSADAGSRWSWHKIGGDIAPGTGPGACYSSAIHGNVAFITGGDGALWQYSPAYGWERIGGRSTSSPDAAEHPCEHKVYAYVRGGDGALWQYDVSTATWTSYGGYILPGTGPDVARDSAKGSYWMDVGVIGGDHALWHFSSANGWQKIGGYLTSSPRAAARVDSEWGVLYLALFARGGDGTLWWYERTSGGCSCWTALEDVYWNVKN